MEVWATVLLNPATVLAVALLSAGCNSTSTNSASVSPYDPQLFDLEGRQVSAGSINIPGKVLFFTCGCAQCRVAAKDLRSVSQGMACVGDIESKDLRAFVREVGWLGSAYVDPGGSFSIKHNVASCPRFLKMDSGTWREVQLADLTSQSRKVNL